MNKDFLKEKISFLKFWTAFIMAIIIGSTAWLVKNWGTVAVSFNSFVIILIIIAVTVAAIINRKAYHLIKEMKKMKNMEK